MKTNVKRASEAYRAQNERGAGDPGGRRAVWRRTSGARSVGANGSNTERCGVRPAVRSKYRRQMMSAPKSAVVDWKRRFNAGRREHRGMTRAMRLIRKAKQARARSHEDQ
jgi:hypothetical protein